MPEKCLFCGEIAVIEESVDGGKDQLICIECGTLAGASQVIKSSDFADDDYPFVDNLDDESNTAANECISCGIELDSSDDRSGSSFSLKHRKLCSDCAELDDIEFDVKDTESTHTCSNDTTVVSQKSKDQDGAVEAVHGGTTHELKSKCSSCGGSDLVVDSVGGDERLICTDCGQVNSDAILTADSFTRNLDNDGTTYAKYHKATLPNFARHQRQQEGLIVGHSQISTLCTKFCFPSSLKTEAEDMYRSLYAHPKIRHITYRKKECVAAVCLFIVCRQSNLPVSITHFRKDVSCFSLFLKMKKFLQKKLKIKLPHISATSQITEIVDRLKFDQKLTNKLKDILFLFRKAWVSQGRNRKGLISMAAYYAYVSSSKCPKFITYKEYFATHKLCGFSRLLVSECQKTMCKLAASLPWLNSKSKVVTPRTLPGYIDSVLEYQESLFHLVFKPEERLVEIETLTATSLPSNVKTNDSDIEEKKPLVPHWQKEPLLPYSSKKPKLDRIIKDCYIPIPSDIDLDSPILKETEFEDEISSYILTAEEQERVREQKLRIIFNKCV